MGRSRADEISWAARRTVEMLAAEQPLVLVVEDIHWARPAMLELSTTWSPMSAGPILVVCPARPELLESAGGLVGTGGAPLDGCRSRACRPRRVRS